MALKGVVKRNVSDTDGRLSRVATFVRDTGSNRGTHGIEGYICVSADLEIAQSRQTHDSRHLHDGGLMRPGWAPLQSQCIPCVELVGLNCGVQRSGGGSPLNFIAAQFP